jgi:tetratricopeptide (TPR) repeat protein
VPNWLPIAFAGVGLVLGLLRLGNEMQIPRFKKAVKSESYSKALQLFPKANGYWCSQDATSVPLAWYAGIVAEHAGNWTQALAFYKEGLTTSPYNVRDLNSAGIAFYRLGQQDSAIAYFQRSVAIASGWDEPYLNWMAALFAQPATQMQAFQLMAKLPDYKPDPRWPLFKKVLLEYRLKAAKPTETLENQVRIDSLLADKTFPEKAFALYIKSNKKDSFWQ